MEILHITPHLGGGVGSVILAWMQKDESDTRHTILSLDKNKNSDWREVNENRPNVTIYDGCWFNADFKNKLDEKIEASDIVVLHWWNHPLTYEVMLNYRWPPCRLVIWNHVNSLWAPYSMPDNLIDFCDHLVFTSPVSYECVEVKNWLKEWKGDKISVIWSNVGNEDFKHFERKPHDGFIIGYTGTADYGKLHPDYIKMCSQVNIPDARFIFCSGDSQGTVKKEAAEYGILNRFEFMGRVPSVLPYLAEYDVFGYPLQPKHFATCEQSLGEAMMAGCVPVVLNNPTERYIVHNMETGMVVNTPDEYSHAIEYLYYNNNEYKRMQKNGRDFALKLYDINIGIAQWNKLFEDTMKCQRTKHKWNGKQKYTPSELYIESLGAYGKAFVDNDRNEIKNIFIQNSMFNSKSKGSPKQYLQFFPNDLRLKEWISISQL